MKVIPWNGKPITKPGVYSGIPIRRYHSAGICDGPSVSSSNLRTAWKDSLAHMFDQWPGNPNAESFETTASMTLGSAAHHLILGEEAFSTHFIGQPETYRDVVTAEEKKWTYAAKPCKAWRDKQEKAGREIVTQKQLEAIRGIARSLQLEPLVADGCLEGLCEHSMMVKDKETGLWLRVRPDVIPTASGNYVDLKTAEGVSDLHIFKSLRSYNYHMQGGLIWEVCDQLGMNFEDFTLIWCETSRPFCTRAVPVTDEDLSRGRLQCRAMLRKMAACIDSGIWPGPGAGELRPIPLPTREREEIDYRLTQEGGQ